jgi:hypothetical protein
MVFSALLVCRWQLQIVNKHWFYAEKAQNDFALSKSRLVENKDDSDANRVFNTTKKLVTVVPRMFCVLRRLCWVRTSYIQHQSLVLVPCTGRRMLPAICSSVLGQNTHHPVWQYVDSKVETSRIYVPFLLFNSLNLCWQRSIFRMNRDYI